jgi:hypothetical protein
MDQVRHRPGEGHDLSHRRLVELARGGQAGERLAAHALEIAEIALVRLPEAFVAARLAQPDRVLVGIEQLIDEAQERGFDLGSGTS